MLTSKSITVTNEGVLLTVPCFEPALTLDCGQTFRWKVLDDGSVHGVAKGRALTVKKVGGSVLLCGVGKEEFESIWREYFDLDRDYAAVCGLLRADKHLCEAVEYCYGIRIVRQDAWEALCSFIISQNNNIPRIKGIVERLCVMLGEPLGDGDYTFPPPDKVLAAGVEGLAQIRSGFRAKYIIAAAQAVCSGEIDLEAIARLPLETAQEQLVRIKGVGPKVAQCVLLYGMGRVDAFPIDVWVKRIMQEMYPCGLPECTKGNEGIAQQYLFHMRRNK